MRSREDIDEAHAIREDAGTPHHPSRRRTDGWAPGYYSILFEDPDGVRLELNFVPGKGVFDTEEKTVNPVYPRSKP